jgi:hypothetical protein
MRFRMYALFMMSLTMTHGLYGQEKDTWYPGTLTLKSQTVLKGEISVRVDYNVVFLRKDQDLVVYPAHKVQSVVVYDAEEKKNRSFTSLQFAVGAATANNLYEVVVDGEISVLRKQRVLWYSVHLEIPEEDYYVWRENQLVSLYHFTRKEFPRLVKASNGNMKFFMKSHKLNPKRMRDMIEILGYYNEQRLSESQLAMKE